MNHALLLDPARASHPADLLTPKEAAALCRVPVRTLLAWVAAGRLRALRLSPKTIRVRLDDLAAFLAAA